MSRHNNCLEGPSIHSPSILADSIMLLVTAAIFLYVMSIYYHSHNDTDIGDLNLSSL